MGKTQKKSSRGAARKSGRVDPLAKNATAADAAKKVSDGANAEEGDEVVADVGEEVVATIAAQLKDASSETQECGLQSLSLLVDHHSHRVVDSKLVRVAAPLMLSKHPNVAHAATGAIRNLSLVSADVCDHMVDQDVMTPLCALVNTYAAADWSAAADRSALAPAEVPAAGSKAKAATGEEVIDSKTEIFVEAANLLWNLCEANSTALAVFNREGLGSTLLKHLAFRDGEDRPRYPARVRLTVMQCLYSVTEENPDFNSLVRQNSALLERILNHAEASPAAAYLRILALGTLINVGGEEEDFRTKMWPVAVGVIAGVLDMDQRKMCNEYTSLCPLKEVEEGATNTMEEDTTVEDKLESLKEDLNNTVQAQQTALEILTNLLCGEEEEGGDRWAEDEDESGDSDHGDDMETSSSGGGDNNTSLVMALPADLAEVVRSSDLAQKVLAKANFPADNVCQILKEDTRNQGKNLLKMLSTLRSRAFLCLNNLVSSLTPEDLGGSDGLFQTWTSLGLLCFKEEEKDMDLMESATSAMRAVTQALLECKSDKFRALTEEDVGRMLLVGARCPEAKVRVNVVHVSGAVGLLLAEEKSCAAAAEAIAAFLVEAAGRDSNLRVVSEALDKLFDMFGEDSTDEMCVRLGLVGRLRQVLPGLKAKMGAARRRGEMEEEDHAMAAMARTNLVRFIRYKEKRGVDK